MRELQAARHETKHGKPFDKGNVYRTLTNRTYIGRAVHKGIAYAGEHEAIIDEKTFEQVSAILATKHSGRTTGSRGGVPRTRGDEPPLNRNAYQ